MKKILVLLILAFALPTTLSAALADERLGIVFLPHKGGKLGPLPLLLKNAGFLVEGPTMNWFSRTYEDTMPVIDRLVARLRKQGAKRIVVGGHSLGANVALGYGARREGLAGILAVAPGHVPGVAKYQLKLKRDYLRAQKLVDAGKGDLPGRFRDLSPSGPIKRRTTANIYITWFDPAGPAVFRKNAASLKPGTPLLWIIGRSDIMHSRGMMFAFNHAPSHPKNHYEVIEAGHLDAPQRGATKIIQWLKSL